jgi:hypothetical protein
MMYLMQSVALAAWMFGAFISAGWPGPLGQRLSLGGLYLLIGTVAACGAAVLWELKGQGRR